MLDSFRQASRSWYAKLLFILLILSFGIWGVGDVVRQHADSQPAIKVGSESISAAAVVDEFRRDTDRLAKKFNGKITLEDARKLGLVQQTIRQMVNRALLDQASDEMKFTVSNEELRKIIAGTSVFQNELKTFDKDVYQRVLDHAGFTEKQFTAMQRKDTTRDLLTRMIAGGITGPLVQADPLFTYRQEQREMDKVVYELEKQPDPPKPNDAALQAYYKAHETEFQAPELRAITGIILRPEDVSGDIKPTDEQITTAYQARQGEFQKAETRAVEVAQFLDEAKAKAFFDTVKDGKDFAGKAKAEKIDVIDLGKPTKKSMPIAELSDAAFSMKSPGVAAPVKTPLGVYVLHMSEILPGKLLSLEDVRDLVIKGLVQDEANTRLYAKSTALEDALGSGASVEEAANNLKLKTFKLPAVDKDGNGADGRPFSQTPLSQAMLKTAFITAKGESSQVGQLEKNEGYFAVHVDEITPPAPRTLDAIADQVQARLIKEIKLQNARKLADSAADRIRKGEAIEKVAAPLDVEKVAPFVRTPTADRQLSATMVAEAFKAKVGDVIIIPTENGAILSRLNRIIPADKNELAGLYDQSRKQLGLAIGNDLMLSYVAELEKKYGATVNMALIDRQLGDK